ncbi:carbohydrate esterase family 4 protein [Artomyces pyxidatus]|uniref:Carbohydrate esterase family 4 protein n=1 Tax=Artomyces pyxidatus TaxID=48021 RepID=A0ACB8T0P2_9AGAM|nr:carbohydrate esterase family 4 protein [Artomyces pyxidatus]
MQFTTLAAFLSLLVVTHALPAPGDEHSKRGLANVYYSCNTPNTVAMTFDDGPYIYEQGIVNTLNQNGVKGTFFINGDNWECVYDSSTISSLKSAYNSGHQIGSHTWHHYDLTTLTWDQINDEMWRTELAMRRILGVAPAIMRPPYGNFNDLVRSAGSVRNQSVIIWDFDDGDSTGSTVAQSEADYQTLVNQHPNNVLALNHETYETSAHQAIPYAIQKLKAAGYKFATVSECLGLPAYSWYGAPQTKDSSWTC